MPPTPPTTPPGAGAEDPAGAPLLPAPDPAWALTEDGRALRRELRFPTWAATMAFVNAVADLAEREDHHPELLVGWGRVVVTWTTHDVGGLSERDRRCAAAVDLLLRGG